MKRRLFIFALFLLLGAVLNVAVAWGCMIVWPKSHCINVYYWEGDLDSTPALRILESLLPSEDYARRDHTILISDQSRFGWIVYGATSVAGFEPADLVLSVDVFDAGLPLKSFRGSYRTTKAGGRPWSAREGTSHTLMIPSWMRPPQSGVVLWYGFPFLPIWPGFAVNTIFYVAILWLPIRGPFALRRHIRRKREVCVTCGYDLRHADHAACPECGAAIHLQRAVAPRIE